MPSKILPYAQTSSTPCETEAFPTQGRKSHLHITQHSHASRATLSSKVTEPFCRLPLHTLCPKLEAINLEHLLRFVERLDWKLTLSLQFSWRTKKAGRRKNGFLLFKRKEKDQRIILINNSFKGRRTPNKFGAQPLFSLFKQKRDLCCRFFLLA